MFRFFVRVEMLMEVCDIKFGELITDKIGVVAVCMFAIRIKMPVFIQVISENSVIVLKDLSLIAIECFTGSSVVNIFKSCFAIRDRFRGNATCLINLTHLCRVIGCLEHRSRRVALQ